MTWQLVAAIIGGSGIAGIVGNILTGLFSRPVMKADAVAKLTESAIRQVDELQERATAAEQAADQARAKIRTLSDEVDSLIGQMRRWRAEILSDPTASERLRQLVSADPGQHMNGRPF